MTDAEPGNGRVTDSSWVTLVDIIRSRARNDPERKMFKFLENGTDVSAELTTGQLDRQARAIAGELSAVSTPGDRALLHYGPGLDFISGFFGCMYAGLVAVPVAPIEANRSDIRNKQLSVITRSARPRVILGTSGMLSDIGPVLSSTEEMKDVLPVGTDGVDLKLADKWEGPELDPAASAYLQYSSGSTGSPKGVALSHQAVVSNLALIHENGSRSDEEDFPAPPVVLWLPLFHDMGLVNGILQPLYADYEATLMSPLSFVQRPVNWLRQISRLGRTLSVAPNFAFDLCVQRVTPRQRRDLDLSGWELAAVGAEPVRADTLERFCETFGPQGFRREAFFPCYGLAESTVMVSGGPAGQGPVTWSFDASELEASRVRAATEDARKRVLVGCGQVQPTLTVEIVDPGTGEPLPGDRVGEIHVAGDSVGSGYWDAPEQTDAVFRARIEGRGEQEFLRTGDLGFIWDGQLFVTGRLKDVIILDGRNYHPHDIELTATGCHPAVRDRFCAAFSVEDGRRERLVVLAEVAGGFHLTAGSQEPAGEEAGGSLSGAELEQTVKRAITAEHGIQVDDLVLLCSGSLPFTSSGKVKRLESRERYQQDGFEAQRAD